MFERRRNQIDWCWIDKVNNTPAMLEDIDMLFKEQNCYTKFKPEQDETEVHCVYVRNDEPYFNSINRERFY